MINVKIFQFKCSSKHIYKNKESKKKIYNYLQKISKY